MKINIFGVGRSGTKAIQLYLSYLIAKKEGDVLINYEPYYWKDRRTLNLNYEGIYHHVNSPLILTNNRSVGDSHFNYLLKLKSHHQSIVTKFIRANGRIDYINKITEPDLSIIIIRDLYQVLSSLTKFKWDLLGNGLVYKNDWNRLVSEVKEKEIIKSSDLNYYLKHISNDNDRNAFYWYIMNLLALKHEGNNTFFVNYENINYIEEIAYKCGLSVSNYRITNKIFKGQNLGKDFPLIEVDENNEYGFSEIGSLNKINSKDISISHKYSFKENCVDKINNKALYDFFVKDIKRKLQLKGDLIVIGKDKVKTTNFTVENKGKERKYITDKVKKLYYQDKYRYVISQELLNYLLNSYGEKVAIMGTDIRGMIVCKFIQGINKIMNKKIKVVFYVENTTSKNSILSSKRVKKLNEESMEKIDSLAVANVWEEEVFDQLLALNLEPKKIIFSNKKYPKAFWDGMDVVEKERFSYLDKFKIWEPIMTKELDSFINQTEVSNIIIFGAGGIGLEIFKLIEEANNYLNKKINVTAFMDNDCDKWGKELSNRKISNPDIDKFEGVEKVIIASAWGEDINKQLLDMGVEKEKIIYAI